jgi:hypothetical protein
MNLDILEIFAEAAQVPSHTRERRHYQRALRDLDRRRLKRQHERWEYASSCRRKDLNPLPWACACATCGRHFGHERGLQSHLLYWKYRDGACACASATAQAAE